MKYHSMNKNRENSALFNKQTLIQIVVQIEIMITIKSF